MSFQSSISRPSSNWISSFLARVSFAPQCSARRLGMSKAGCLLHFCMIQTLSFRFVSDGFLHFQFDNRCFLQARKIMYRSCKGLLKVCLVKGLREYAIYQEIWSLKRRIQCNALLEWPPNNSFQRPKHNSQSNLYWNTSSWWRLKLT